MHVCMLRVRHYANWRDHDHEHASELDERVLVCMCDVHCNLENLVDICSDYDIRNLEFLLMVTSLFWTDAFIYSIIRRVEIYSLKIQ